MSSSRLLIMGVVIIAVVSVTLAVVDSDEPNLAELTKKIDALTAKIDNLEKKLDTRLNSIDTAIAKGGGNSGPSPQLESQAQAAYGQINSLVSSGKFEEAKKQMEDFMSKYGATTTARSARRLSAELQVIGKDAPASWAIEKWYQGESDVDLASDQTTLLVFWEVWCPHCKREVPKLQALYDSLKGDGLQVVGLTKVNRSATDESVVDFIKEKNLAYPCAKETGELSAHFGVSGVPAAAVLKDGKVVWRGHPARLSESMLKAWL